ncbi:hypothetical protein ACWEOZ_02595 [Actinoplanes sp. NPDC004185]
MAPPRPPAELVGTAAEPDPAGPAGAPEEAAAAEAEPAELAGAPEEAAAAEPEPAEELAGLAGAPVEELDAAAEPFELLEPKTEPAGRTAAETLPGLTGRADAEAGPSAPPDPSGLPETEAEPDTEARPLLDPLTGAALTGADAEARAVEGVPEDGDLAASVPDAGAHSAPGAGGGGSSYPWSLFGPALLAGGRAAGGVLPSLSGFACCSSMGPPDRRHPRADATCRTPGRPIAGRLVTTVPHQRS